MIAYYAHCHGYGHSNRARIFAAACPDAYHILTSSDYHFPTHMKVRRLPTEHLDGTELDLERFPIPDYLHWAPAGMKKVAHRNRAILGEVIQHHSNLLVVDVSAEVAALARVSSIPYAYVRMMGNRHDPGHRYAYQGAAFLIAFYPESFESPDTPDWVREKCIYTGFLTDRNERRPGSTQKQNREGILILSGNGGSRIDGPFVDRIARQWPTEKITVVGGAEVQSHLPNVTCKGLVPDTTPFVDRAKTIIAACGTNTISELLRAGRQFLIVPEERPFEEQICWANALVRNKLGVVFDEENPAESRIRLDQLPTIQPGQVQFGDPAYWAKYLLDWRVHFGVDASTGTPIQYS